MFLPGQQAVHKCNISMASVHLDGVNVEKDMSCLFFVFLQSGEVNPGRVCYHWGLPRLVCELL